MITQSKPVVIEIPEDAYKQNKVYRPWPEIKASNPDSRKPGVTPLSTTIAAKSVLSALGLFW